MIIIALIICSFPAVLTARQDAAPEQAPPGVEVRIQAQPRRATVGDPIQIDLDFTLPPGWQLQFPSLTPQLGEFTVLDVIPGPIVPSPQPPGAPSSGSPGSGIGHHQARIAVAVYKPGDFEFPALTFALRDPAGKEVRISSPAVRIEIASVLAKDDIDLRDLKKQAEIEEPPTWLWWLALGLPVLALIYWLIRRWRKRRPRPAFLPPTQPEADPLDLAEASLNNLIRGGLLERGMVKQFYVVMSDIVKKALDASYGIQTVEKTTAEIVLALAAEPPANHVFPDHESLERVENLLLSCDMVKFARYLPSQAENDLAIKQAFQVLLDCRSRRHSLQAGAAPVAGVS